MRGIHALLRSAMLYGSSWMAIRLLVFDAYGTLFDVAAAAGRAATESGAEVLISTRN